MTVGFKAEIALIGLAALALVSSQGCSLFRSNFTSPDEANSFHATASTMNNPVPLPVEIVSDISAIQSGGKIQQQGVWRPTFDQDGELSAEQVTTPGEPPKTSAAPQVESDQMVPVGEPQMTAEDATAKTESTNTASIKLKRRPTSMARGGKSETYRVRRGDTLMKISFEKFGNVYRWREILEANRGVIGKSAELTVGMNLTIAGVEYVVIERNGEPYLIRKRDTLAKISNGLYGTPREWPKLWNNNRQLIRDPNKIYAGFTLYYQPLKNGRSESVPRKPTAIKIAVPAIADLPAKAPKEVSAPNEPVGVVPPTGPEAWKPTEN